MICLVVAGFGGVGDSGTTWVGEAEDFCNLVKNFADGIVASAAEDGEVVVCGHADNLSVSTREDKGKKRKVGVVSTEPVGVDVGFEVMDRVERDVVDDGESASGQGANE